MTRDEIFTVVKANIEKIIEGAAGQPIDESISLHDLGADSLEMVEVVSRSMKELKIKVPRTELATAHDLRELTDLFEKAAGQQTATPTAGAQ